MGTKSKLTGDYVDGVVAETNYIKGAVNPTDINGWTAYANTAAANKPDDFGGAASGNIALTANTTTPIFDTSDLKLAKTGGLDEQGEGYYYDFTLEEIHLAQMLVTKLMAKPDSNFADGDVRIYIVSSSDSFVADFNIIEPAPTELLASTLVQQSQFEWQSDASDTTYRLCIHVASTSTANWNIQFSHIQTGDISRTFGPVMQDWESVTMSGTWSTNTTYTALRQRVGDTAYYKVKIDLSGAPSGALYVDLPTGDVIDNDKLFNSANNRTLGSVIFEDDDVSAESITGSVSYFNTTRVRIFYHADTATANAIKAEQVDETNSPFTFAANDQIYIEFSAPILGWSSSQIQSSDADTRVVACRAGPSTTGWSFSATDSEVVGDDGNFDEVTYDTHGGYDATSGEYTVPVSGFYEVSCAIDCALNVVFGTRLFLSAQKNGSRVSRLWGVEVDAANSDKTTSMIGTSPPIECVKGDVLRANVNTTVASISGSSSETNFLAFKRLSGPSQIAASEVVAASARLGATETARADGVIIFATEAYDTHDAYDDTTGEFTVPVSGKYRLSAQAKYGSLDAAALYRLHIVLNATVVNSFYASPGSTGSTADCIAAGSEVLDLVKGDVVYLSADGDASFDIDDGVPAKRTFFSIERIGGIG